MPETLIGHKPTGHLINQKFYATDGNNNSVKEAKVHTPHFHIAHWTHSAATMPNYTDTNLILFMY